jgi:hypothetical protein
VVVVVATGPITRRAKRTNSTAEPSRGPPRRELGVRRARVTSSHGSGSKGAASSPAVTRQTEMPLSSRPGKETGTDRHVRSPRRPRAMPMCHRWAGDGDGTRPVARHDSSRPQVLIIPAPRGGRTQPSGRAPSDHMAAGPPARPPPPLPCPLLLLGATQRPEPPSPSGVHAGGVGPIHRGGLSPWSIHHGRWHIDPSHVCLNAFGAGYTHDT